MRRRPSAPPLGLFAVLALSLTLPHTGSVRSTDAQGTRALILVSRTGPGLASQPGLYCGAPPLPLAYMSFLPLAVRNEVCRPIALEDYGTLSVESEATPGPIERNPDFNITMRGWQPTDQLRAFVDYHNPADPLTPQFPGLFADQRTPAFTSVHQVRDWDWGRMAPGPLIADPPVTLLGLGTRPGETLHVPDSGYTIGSGYEVLVLYASPVRITLKYTREDHVVYGYTLHLENVCVEPRLVALYDSCADAGRRYLPALRPGQAFGRAVWTEALIAIRDSGTFLDPRSHFDWWRGR